MRKIASKRAKRSTASEPCGVERMGAEERGVPSDGAPKIKYVLSLVALAAIACTVACPDALSAPSDTLWQRYTDEGKSAKKDGNLAEAEKEFRAALERALQLHETGAVLRESCENLATTRYLHGHYDDAVPLFRQAIDNYRAALKSNEDEARRNELRDRMITDLMALADCYRAQGKYKQGELMYREALASINGAPDNDHNKLVKAHVQSELGDCLCVESKYADAEALYQQAMPVFEKYKATDYLVDLLQDYDALLRATNRSAQAEKLEEKVSAIRAQEAASVNRANK